MRADVLDHGHVALIDAMPRPAVVEDARGDAIASGDQRIVDAARVSIAGKDVESKNPPERLIRYLLKNRHTTPFEQVRLTFYAKMPIFVARQWVRHRTASINEMSARYGKLPAEMYVPSIERIMAGAQATKNKQGSQEGIDREEAERIQCMIENANEAAYGAYEDLLQEGLARELARGVLPANIYTQWYWTTDLHNLFHFLRLRLHPHAQWEFRQYAEAMLPMAEAVAPIAVQAFRDFVLEES